MDKSSRWAKGLITWGVTFVTLALIVAVVGLLLPFLVRGIVLPDGVIPGVSVMLLALGIAGLAQSAYVRHNPNAANQMMIREQDERFLAIRDRAGHLAFNIASSLAFLVLLWAAFAKEVGLPALSGTTLFVVLLVVVGLPYLFYVANIATQHNSG